MRGRTLIVELRWPADVVQEMVIAELSIFYRSPEGSMTRISKTLAILRAATKITIFII